MSSFQCTECGAAVVIPLKCKTVSCRRCGDVSFVNDGAPRRVYPALHMLPVDHPHEFGPDYPLSKWMLSWTRPVTSGNYHVRFRHTEPTVYIARWDGVAFRTPTGERVRMGNFLTWRGLLA